MKQSLNRPVQRFEAIWLDGSVPIGYWDRFGHRRLYLRWLGQRLGFRKPEDWYRLTTDDFKRNRGGGVLAIHWGSSAIIAVKECFPDYDWKEWLFQHVPSGYWDCRRNRRHYMRWLGHQLGIRRSSDWYKVSNQDFMEHNAGGLLGRYDSTISLAIMDCLPNVAWKEWVFSKTPKGFWQKRANRRRYMRWLGKRLAFTSMTDWYSVIDADFAKHYGREFLKFYHGSPVAALRDCFPRHTWNEWMFARVPVDFWDTMENRRRYMDWLAKRLKVETPNDWQRVRRADFQAHCGGGLLARYCSHSDVIREYVAELKPETR